MIRLQIQDNNGKIVQDDELLVENGDILLCQITSHFPPAEMPKLGKNISGVFKQAFERSNNGELIPLIFPEYINFKVLKISQENNIPNKDIIPPKYDTVSEGFDGPLG